MRAAQPRAAGAQTGTGDHILLLHGLWMRGFALGMLANRLRHEGFAVEVFEYTSVTGGPERALLRLRERFEIAARSADRVHLVGHSLGGLVALEAARGIAPRAGERIVCLGSPLKGSSAVNRLTAWPGGSWLVGKSLDRLREGVAAWQDQREVGVIAGRLPFGLGMFSDGLEQPHDGTVSVAETRLDGVADHHVVAATHTGLVYSDEVARLTAGFLREGRFQAVG